MGRGLLESLVALSVFSPQQALLLRAAFLSQHIIFFPHLFLTIFSLFFCALVFPQPLCFSYYYHGCAFWISVLPHCHHQAIIPAASYLKF